MVLHHWVWYNTKLLNLVNICQELSQKIKVSRFFIGHSVDLMTSVHSDATMVLQSCKGFPIRT